MHEHTCTAALTTSQLTPTPTPTPTLVRFPCTAAPLVSMLLPLAQDEERGGRVLALLEQVPYFTERLDMDQDDLDHAPGQEEGTLVCGARKVVYASGECCARLGCGQVCTAPLPLHSQPTCPLARRLSSLPTPLARWCSWEQTVRLHFPQHPQG